MELHHWNSCWTPGMKCGDCDNELPQDLAGNMCSGYMDFSEGNRTCYCCAECRAACHEGRMDEEDGEEPVFYK